MKNIELIVRILIQKNKKVLLCQSKKQGHYFLPGGHVEFGDTLEETIYKEMNEELGFQKEDLQSISFLKYLENSYQEENKRHQEINFIFIADLKDDVDIKSQEDHIDFSWIDLEEIKNINLLPKGIL